MILTNMAIRNALLLVDYFIIGYKYPVPSHFINSLATTN